MLGFEQRISKTFSIGTFVFFNQNVTKGLEREFSGIVCWVNEKPVE